jgi:hypothetical protein
MALGDERILDRLYAAEDMLRAQASTLDTKAGFFLVILGLLADTADHLHFFNQGVAVALAFAIISGFLAIASIALSPRHAVSALALEKHRDETIEKNHGKSDAVIVELITTAMINGAKLDVQEFKDRNEIKARLLMASYFSMLVAFTLMAVLVTFNYFGW